MYHLLYCRLYRRAKKQTKAEDVPKENKALQLTHAACALTVPLPDVYRKVEPLPNGGRTCKDNEE